MHPSLAQKLLMSKKDPFTDFLQKIGSTITEKLPKKEDIQVIEEVIQDSSI
jgi:hypothetical protein